MKLTDILRQIIQEKKSKRDRCLRIADRKFNKPSAYKSGAVVRCRKGKIWKGLKEEQTPHQQILDKIKTYKIPYEKFNQEIKKEIPTWKIDYNNDLSEINEMVARDLLYQISKDLFGGVEEIEFKNQSKSPINHFQMVMDLGKYVLYTNPFIYIDNNHKAIANEEGQQKTKILILDENYDDLAILKEEEQQTESYNPNIYEIICRAVFKIGNRNMSDILSDMRAIPGITTIDVLSSEEDNALGKRVLKLDIKVDPSPFNPFSKSSFDEILSNIKKLPDIIGAQFISPPTITENISLTEKKKETLRTWFKRKGAPGKTGGWVDCNSPIRKDGKITGYKPCGRQKGEERAKYPSCRPTAAGCKDKGKGTKWGKTK